MQLIIWRFPKVGVPLNHPGFSLISHAFLGTPIYGNLHFDWDHLQNAGPNAGLSTPRSGSRVFSTGRPKAAGKTQPFTLHTFHIVTLIYPPLIKHGNGKSNLHGCFKWDIIYEYLSIVIFPLPCLITRG